MCTGRGPAGGAKERSRRGGEKITHKRCWGLRDRGLREEAIVSTDIKP